MSSSDQRVQTIVGIGDPTHPGNVLKPDANGAMPISGNLSVGNLTVGAVSGNLTNNDGAPGSNLLGALTAVAGNVTPTYGNGNLTLLSVDLTGQLRATDAAAEASLANIDSSTTTTASNTGSTAASTATLASDINGSMQTQGNTTAPGFFQLGNDGLPLDYSALSTKVVEVGGTAVALVTGNCTYYGLNLSSEEGNISSGNITFLQVFNHDTGNVTLGSTTPDGSFRVPEGGGNNIQEPNGVSCVGGGLSAAATTTWNGAVAAPKSVVVTLRYIQ